MVQRVAAAGEASLSRCHGGGGRGGGGGGVWAAADAGAAAPGPNTAGDVALVPVTDGEYAATCAG
jgi:hypothetical protein